MATYTKLRTGEWGVRATAEVTTPRVEVVKKSGEVKTEAVGRLVWSGNGVWLYEIAKGGSEPRVAAARPATRRAWRPCGYPGCSREYCDECDGKGGRSDSWGF